ncbi:MAG: signal peptidase I [Lachnospiraceae bacterium]|nr:signal peptidase I [Lachnospiraceae bacterium]
MDRPKGKPPPGKRRGQLTPEQVIRKRRQRLADRADIHSFFFKLAALAVLLAVLFGGVFGITPMPDDSMSPRLSAGDLVLYYRLADSWSINEVMVFHKDGELYVGRVIARGGDTMEITEYATLVVNGSTVIENDIYYSTPRYDSDVTYPVTLADGEYFILCDQRQGAKDSRYFGPVSESEVLGKVITVVRRSGL